MILSRHSLTLLLGILLALFWSTAALADPKADLAGGMALLDQKEYAAARPLLKRACEGGEMEGCAQLGELLDRGQGGDQDLDAAIVFARRACDAGSATGCAGLGMAIYKSSADQKFTTESYAHVARGCALGSVLGCGLQGYALEYGEGTAVDLARAFELYAQACAMGDNNACNNQGVMIRDGKGRPADAARAFAIFQRSCDAGHAGGCYRGYLIAPGGKDSATGEALIDRACELAPKNSTKYCIKAGNLRVHAMNAAASYEEAAQIGLIGDAKFRRACENGHSEACRAPLSADKALSGRLRKQSIAAGVALRNDDHSAALPLLAESCALSRDGQGCENLARLVFTEFGIDLRSQRWREEAAKLDTACDTGLTHACSARAVLRMAADGDSDIEGAITRIKPYCAAGDEETAACWALKSLRVRRTILDTSTAFDCRDDQGWAPRSSIGVNEYNRRVRARNSYHKCIRYEVKQKQERIRRAISPLGGRLTEVNGRFSLVAPNKCLCTDTASKRLEAIVAEGNKRIKRSNRKLDEAEWQLDEYRD